MKELLVATKNPGKFDQIVGFLDGCDFKFTFLGGLDVEDSDFAEDGETFAANSYKKAKYYQDKTGIDFVIGEDSGVFVDALPGELGVYTRRWGAGEHASDQEWLDYFMQKMEGMDQRGARFVTDACLVMGDKREHFEGETRGVITVDVKAPLQKGIPLSSCFIADGMDRVYAALSHEEKLGLSHRGKALKNLRDFLTNQ